MASRFDFTTLDDQELLYGYQRVNRTRFPDHFIACSNEIRRRGLTPPERFEIDPIGADFMTSFFDRIGGGLHSVTNLITRKPSNPEL